MYCILPDRRGVVNEAQCTCVSVSSCCVSWQMLYAACPSTAVLALRMGALNLCVNNILNNSHYIILHMYQYVHTIRRSILHRLKCRNMYSYYIRGLSSLFAPSPPEYLSCWRWPDREACLKISGWTRKTTTHATRHAANPTMVLLLGMLRSMRALIDVAGPPLLTTGD